MNRNTGLALSAPWWSKVESRLEVALWLTLLIVPVVVGLAWGAYFDDRVYATFRWMPDGFFDENPAMDVPRRG